MLRKYKIAINSHNLDSNYVESNSTDSDIRHYVAVLAKNGVKKIQATGYNGARTVYLFNSTTF